MADFYFQGVFQQLFFFSFKPSIPDFVNHLDPGPGDGLLVVNDFQFHGVQRVLKQNLWVVVIIKS